MRRLDVAILVYNLDTTGGMERQARELAERLARRGGRVRIVTSFFVEGHVPRLPPGVPFYERRGRLRIFRVPCCLGWTYESDLAFYEIATVAILMRRPPDAIYAVQWTAGVHGVRVGRVLSSPLFVKFAGGGINGDLASLARMPGGRAAIATLVRADRIVCISPQIEEEARAAGFVPERLLRIPNGVDLDRFRAVVPAAVPGPPDAERILFVGALRREKRLPDLVHAFARVAAARPRALLVVAGEGPEGPRMREVARSLGIEDRILFLGNRDRREIPTLLAAAHAFVLPSESEGLSNALLEALAAGAPVVASDVEGNRAVVTDEREALLFPLDDVPAFARALERVLADRDLAARLARAGQERAQTYSFDVVAARYEEEVAKCRRRAPSSAALLLRYVLRFEGMGVSRLVERGARRVGLVAWNRIMSRVKPRTSLKTLVTTLVVVTKRFLGIRRELFPRRRVESEVQ